MALVCQEFAALVFRVGGSVQVSRTEHSALSFLPFWQAPRFHHRNSVPKKARKTRPLLCLRQEATHRFC